ncbi:MAG: O-methyltransferase [Chloroflexi bacterium]|nr:O-methyltransferase [Chloroflexota bacterium]
MDGDTRSQLDSYITDLYAREDDTLRWIQQEASRHELPQISLKPFEGRLMQFLVSLAGAKKVVEIGTLAGYSGVWIARALPPDGRLYTLERSSKHAQVARASFRQAGLADKVEVIEGDARESLRQLSTNGPFDLVFIDADKASYPDYLAWAIDNLRPGGVVAAHNAFRGGRILMPESDEDRAMLAFNRAIAEHPQLDSMILAIGDGMAVGIRKG